MILILKCLVGRAPEYCMDFSDIAPGHVAERCFPSETNS